MGQGWGAWLVAGSWECLSQEAQVQVQRPADQLWGSEPRSKPLQEDLKPQANLNSKAGGWARMKELDL